MPILSFAVRVLTVLVGAMALAMSAEASPAVVSAELLGAKPVRLQKGPTVLLFNGLGYCSGVLVGPREVLTAAHCLESNLPIQEFSVWIGKRRYAPAAGFKDARHLSEDTVTVENGRFDLGMLILAVDVPKIAPLPIMSNLQIRKGQRVEVSGFGLSDDLNGQSWLNMGRRARAVVGSVLDGVFRTSHIESNSSVCAGDSGGPVARTVGSYRALVGITSAGMNEYRGNTCLLNLPGISQYVDLQSPFARSFLSRFPAVLFVDGRLIKLRQRALRLSRTLRRAAGQRNLRMSRSILRLALKRVNSWRYLPDAKRLSIVVELRDSLKKSLNKNDPGIRWNLAKSRKLLRELINLGVAA